MATFAWPRLPLTRQRPRLRSLLDPSRAEEALLQQEQLAAVQAVPAVEALLAEVVVHHHLQREAQAGRRLTSATFGCHRTLRSR